MGLRAKGSRPLDKSITFDHAMFGFGSVLVCLCIATMTAGCGARQAGSTTEACATASRLQTGFVRLKDFDVFGVSGRSSRVATDPLFPSYPQALLPQKIRLQARQRLTKSLRVTAVDCKSGQSVLFYVRDNPNQRPMPVSRFRRNGVRSVRLSWPPPLSAPDPPSWLLAPLFYEPGIDVLTFSSGATVVEQLSVRVCVPRPGPTAEC